MSITTDGEPEPSNTGPDSVGTGEIIDGEVMTVDLDDGAVTNAKLANGAVDDAKITGPISAGKLDLSGVVAKAGDTMTGALNMGSNDISAVDDLTIDAAGSLNIGDTTVTNSFANTFDVANDLYISGSNDLYLDIGSDLSAMALQLKMDNGRIFLEGGEIRMLGGAAGDVAMGVGQVLDTNYRLLVDHDGDLQFGDGSALQDVRLGWSAANTIAMSAGDKIQQNEAPTAGDDLVNKTYADSLVASGAITAADIANVPAFSIAATDVQAAINELSQESVNKGGDTMTGDLNIGATNTIQLQEAQGVIALLDGDSALAIQNQTGPNSPVINLAVDGDTGNRFQITGGGKIGWGSGTGGVDATLERISAGVIKMGSGDKLQQNELPTVDDDLTNKGYVDGEITSAVNAIVFGDEYQQEYEATVLSTSSGTYANFMTLTTPAMPAGTYRVGWRFDYAKSAASAVGQYRLQVDNTTDLDEKLLSSAANNIEVQYSNFDNIVLGAGVHTIDIDARLDSGGGSFSIDEGKIEIWRVA